MARVKEYLPIGKEQKYKPYHEEYDKLRLASQILNGGGASSFSQNLNDELGMQSELNMLIGSKNGQYYHPDGKYDKWRDAMLPSLKRQLEELEDDFKTAQQVKINEGRRPLKDMPTEMLNKKLRLEAHISIAEEEVAELQRRLEKYRAERARQRRDKILMYGIQGSRRMKHEVVDSVDNQQVDIIDGLPVITEPDSPYKGMWVADYCDLVNVWNNNGKRQLKGAAHLSKDRWHLLPSVPEGVKLHTVPDNIVLRDL